MLVGAELWPRSEGPQEACALLPMIYAVSSAQDAKEQQARQAP